MPRAIKAGAKHRIPVEDDALFDEVRQFALKRNLTWVEYLRYTLDMTKEHEAHVKRSSVKQPANGNRRPAQEEEA